MMANGSRPAERARRVSSADSWTLPLTTVAVSCDSRSSLILVPVSETPGLPNPRKKAGLRDGLILAVTGQVPREQAFLVEDPHHEDQGQEQRRRHAVDRPQRQWEGEVNDDDRHVHRMAHDAIWPRRHDLLPGLDFHEDRKSVV